MHGLYPLFHRTLAFYFSRNGTKFTAYRSSLRTDVKKGLLHRDICSCFYLPFFLHVFCSYSKIISYIIRIGMPRSFKYFFKSDISSSL